MEINYIDRLPAFDWSETATLELMLTGQSLIDQTHSMLQIGDFAVCGFVYRSFTSPPWMWFLLATGVGVRQLVDLVFLSKKIPAGTVTAVRREFVAGHRFAKFYGFIQFDEAYHDGQAYTLYRKS